MLLHLALGVVAARQATLPGRQFCAVSVKEAGTYGVTPPLKYSVQLAHQLAKEPVPVKEGLYLVIFMAIYRWSYGYVFAITTSD